MQRIETFWVTLTAQLSNNQKWFELFSQCTNFFELSYQSSNISWLCTTKSLTILDNQNRTENCFELFSECTKFFRTLIAEFKYKLTMPYKNFNHFRQPEQINFQKIMVLLTKLFRTFFWVYQFFRTLFSKLKYNFTTTQK